ncbi:MAG: hypothetical protein ABIM88_02100 [candidate division WOR-3 bacterium]
MILLLLMLSDYLVMPAEYLDDPVVSLLVFDEDIEVFWGDKSKRMRFHGLAEGEMLLEETGWGKERQGPITEYTRLDLSRIDSIWVYLPLHEKRIRDPLEGCLVTGGCATLGAPVGAALLLSLSSIGIELGWIDPPTDIGGALALGYLELYGGSCLGTIGGCLTGMYIYEKRVRRPNSKAKTQMLLDRVGELEGQEVK